ncbi:DUF305 domain-containing protein [Paraburkholderia fungorum]|uniref:DUF305 domain-containing protein n=1 Tax=Paraburkholderia fungorum TaxID=134537 RepID=UPI002093A0E8|nr:DUF305 domain-containing protein [Paraburkholderia fungorum]USU18517.1 DUF305 domain-containing protein [Paraburkholderia fungorum]USU26420.1 DUF305 domain-containing protein [Paraburkholderia fungorum]
MDHTFGRQSIRQAVAAMMVLAFVLPAFAQHVHQDSMDTGKLPAAAAGSQSLSALMDDSMNTMNVAMAQAPMNGNPDHDFASMMIPHHQGAVDMAKAELLYGTNPILRRLAQEIIVTQGSEITVMQSELNKMPSTRPSPRSATR